MSICCHSRFMMFDFLRPVASANLTTDFSGSGHSSIRRFASSFSSHLTRLFLTAGIWVGLLLLSPDNWPEYVNERIGIPHVWHVFVFALAFSLAINVHRLSAIASARYKRFKLRKRIKMQNDKVRSVIQNLTEEQSMVLCAALNEGRKYVVTSKQFPYISELIELGVLNKTFSRWNGKHILFPIEDIYWTELVASYDPYNIEIKPRPISK